MSLHFRECNILSISPQQTSSTQLASTLNIVIVSPVAYKTQYRCHNKRKRKNTKLKLIKQIAWKFLKLCGLEKKYPFLKCLKNRLQVNQWGWGSLCVQKNLKDGCSIMSAAKTTFMTCDHIQNWRLPSYYIRTTN